jgi:hypothetical protein
VLSVYVDADIKMPRTMFDALCEHERECCARRTFRVSERSVRNWLAQNYDAQLAAAFLAEYMLGGRGDVPAPRK